MAGTLCLENVALDGQLPAGPMSWCRVTNLVAVALQPTGLREARVVLLEPSDAHSHTILRIPLGSPAEKAFPKGQPWGISELDWSPPGSPRVLLVMTHCGKVFGFRQPQKSATELKAINVWQGKPITTISKEERLLALRWLEPQGVWSWPPVRDPAQPHHSTQSPFKLPKEFLVTKADVKGPDQALHWARPGMLTCAAVMSSGHIRIWTCQPHNFSWTERKTSIAGLGDAVLSAADIIVGPAATLRIAAVKQGDPMVLLFEMRGDPTAESCGKPCSKLTVGKLAGISMTPNTMGASLMGIRFDPNKHGRSFLCLLDDKIGGALQLLSYRQKGKSNFEAAGSIRMTLSGARAPKPKPEGSPVPSGGLHRLLACMHISQDGCMLALVLAESPCSVHLIRMGAMQNVCETVQLLESGGALLSASGMAFSPNGTCIAIASAGPCAKDSSPSPRIQILALADYSDMAATSTQDTAARDAAWSSALKEQISPKTQARLAADRLLWCMLHSHHHWDTVMRLQAMASVMIDVTGPDQTTKQLSARQIVLNHVDEAIHCEPHFSRCSVGSEWDHIKVAILWKEPNPVARAVVMDMQARNFLSVLENMFKSYFHQEDFYKLLSRQRQQPSLSAAEIASLRPWVDWVVDYCHFFLANSMRWVQRHVKAAAAEEGKSLPLAEALSPDNLPCVRLISDQAFLKRLTATVIFCIFSLQGSPPNVANPKREKLNRMVDMLKKVGLKIQQAPKPAPVKDTEKIGAELPLAQEAVRCFSGEYHLHYTRTAGGISWKAISEVIGQNQLPTNQAPTPNETIQKAGRILGILSSEHDNTGSGPTSVLFPGKIMPPAAPRSEVRPFVLGLPEEQTAEAAKGAAARDAARRKRWRMDRDTALGIAQQIQLPEGTSGKWQRDMVTAALLTSNNPITHECLDSKFGVSVLESKDSGQSQLMLASCSTTNGITTGRWKRIRED